MGTERRMDPNEHLGPAYVLPDRSIKCVFPSAPPPGGNSRRLPDDCNLGEVSKLLADDGSALSRLILTGEGDEQSIMAALPRHRGGCMSPREFHMLKTPRPVLAALVEGLVGSVIRERGWSYQLDETDDSRIVVNDGAGRSVIVAAFAPVVAVEARMANAQAWERLRGFVGRPSRMSNELQNPEMHALIDFEVARAEALDVDVPHLRCKYEEAREELRMPRPARTVLGPWPMS